MAVVGCAAEPGVAASELVAGQARVPGPDEALTAHVEARGATLETRGGPLVVGFRRLGRGDVLETLPAGEPPSRQGARWVVSRGELVEWWASHRRGVELGATISAAPPGPGLLVAELAVEGMVAFGDTGRRVSFEAPDGSRIHLDDLVVTDADQRNLSARMLGRGDRVRMEVDDHDARYPITIDPVFYAEVQVFGRYGRGPQFSGGVAMSADGTIVVAAVGSRAGVEAVLELHRVDGRYAITRTVWMPSPGDSNGVLAMDSAGDVVLVPGIAETMVFRRRSPGVLAFDVALPTGGLPSLSGDGTRALAGGTVYRREGTTWVLETVLSTEASIQGALARDGASALLGGPTLYRRGPSGWDAGTSVSLPRDDAGPTTGPWVWGQGFGSNSDGSRWIISTTRATEGGAAAILDASGVGLGLDSLFPPPTRPVLPPTAVPCAPTEEGGPTPFLSEDGRRAAYRFACDGGSGPSAGRFIQVMVDDGAGWTLEARFEAQGGTLKSEAYSADATWVAAASFQPVLGPRYDVFPKLEIFHREECAASCTSGFCVDGVCCDTACGNGLLDDCQGCSIARGASRDGICEILGAGRVCRPDDGPCDWQAESCDGVSTACPDDVDFPIGTVPVCRPSTAACDREEVCTNSVCPRDECDDLDECTADGCDASGCTHTDIPECDLTLLDAAVPADAAPMVDAATLDARAADASAPAPDAAAGGEPPAMCAAHVSRSGGARAASLALLLLVLARRRRSVSSLRSSR